MEYDSKMLLIAVFVCIVSSPGHEEVTMGTILKGFSRPGREKGFSAAGFGGVCALSLPQLMLIFFVVLLVLAISACSPKKTEKNSTPQTIRWWHINSDQPAQLVFEELARDFERLHPGVTVKVIMLENMEYKPKLELEFAAGDPPDVFHSWGGGGLAEQAKAGHIRDITDWVKSDRWKSRINPVALDIYSYEGRVYGFPQDLGAVGFWYNREILEKAGISGFPENYDDFIAMCEKLKARGITPLSLGIADRWPVMFYWSYFALRIGGPDIFRDILAKKRSFNDPALIEAGMMMQDLYKRKYFPASAIGDDFNAQSRAVGDGHCAMQLMGQWALAVQAQVSEKKDSLSPLMMFAPFPLIRNGKGGIRDALGGGNGFVIGRNAPDEAIELLEFFTRAENLQKYFNVFPAVPTVKEVSIDNKGLNQVKNYLETMDNYCLYPDQMFPLEMGSLLNSVSARVLLGEITAEEGCAILDEAWSKY